MDILHDILHELIHAAKDTLKLAPFLYLTYLVMEFIEHKGGEKAERIISSSGRLGPLAGGLLGAVPQCGFSAAASGLYAARIVSLGTLISVFLSTSDEMLPIMISEGAGIDKILPILLSKIIIGTVCGFVIDLLISSYRKKHPHEKELSDHIHGICDKESCHCEKGLLLSALIHTLQIILFVFIASASINVIMYIVGEDTLAGFLGGIPVLAEAIAALIGLIPNCAASVLITRLYLDGIISFGPTLAGLLTSSGVGILVLFRTNKKLKQNLAVVLTVYLIGLAAGLFAGLLI